MKQRIGVAAFTIGLLFGLAWSPSGNAASFCDGERIVVQGAGNTLKSVAADVGDKDIFSYDEAGHTAVARTSLAVDAGGTLTLGNPANNNFRETLVFDCAPDAKGNQYSLAVLKGGVMNIYSAEIKSRNSRIAGKDWWDGHRFKGIVFDRGTGRMVNTGISDAAVGVEIKGPERMEIKDCAVRNCGIGLRVFGGWGAPSPIIDGCRTETCAEGIRFENDLNRPEVRNCDLTGAGIGILMTGDVTGPQQVSVLNTGFDRARKTWVAIHREPYSLVLKWSVKFRMLKGDGSPLTAARVRITGTNEKYGNTAPVVAETDSRGECAGDIAECVIDYRKGNPAYSGMAHPTRNRVEIDDGTGYKTVKDDWTPAGRVLLMFAGNKEMAGGVGK